jgi:hypothetical protein
MLQQQNTLYPHQCLAVFILASRNVYQHSRTKSEREHWNNIRGQFPFFALSSPTTPGGGWGSYTRIAEFLDASITAY